MALSPIEKTPTIEKDDIIKAETSDTLSNGKVVKQGDVVFVFIKATKANAIASNVWTNFGVMPLKYRPINYNLGVVGVDNTNDKPCSVQIRTNGNIEVYGASSNAGMKTLHLAFTFIRI